MDLRQTQMLLEDKKALFKEKREEAEEALENDDLDKAKSIKEELEKIKEEIQALDERIEKLENGEEVEEMDNEIRIIDGFNNQRNQYRIIDGANNPRRNESPQMTEYRNYLEHREEPAGLKTDSGFVPVPREQVEEIKKLKDTQFNLRELVTIRDVEFGSGTLPVVRANAEPMVPVKELEKNPDLSVTPFSEVTYDIETYRTQTLLSNELVADAGIDVVKEVKEYFAKITTATENDQIIKVIENGDGVQTVKHETANTVDDVKSILNLQIAPNYEPVVLMNQTAYNELSQLKDKNGRYLMHELPNDQGATFLGYNIIKVPNKLLDGSRIIVGDLQEGICLFDRSHYEVAYDAFDVYGQGLVLATRFDVKIVDPDAMVVIDIEEEIQEDVA